MWAKIITIKRTKDLNLYFSLCALNLNLAHEFHNLSWITEINELFHDILIYWDAPVSCEGWTYTDFSQLDPANCPCKDLVASTGDETCMGEKVISLFRTDKKAFFADYKKIEAEDLAFVIQHLFHSAL